MRLTEEEDAMMHNKLLSSITIALCAFVSIPSLVAAAPSEQPPSLLTKCSMQEEMNKAEALIRSRRFEEATVKCIWLWDHMLEEQPSMYGVRLSFFVGDLKQLTAAHAPAMDAFIEKRDQLDIAVQAGNPEFNELMDWFALNEAVHEKDRSEAWVLSLAERPNGAALFAKAGHRAEEILLENEHYELYGKLCPNIVADAKKEIRQMQEVFEHFNQMPNAQIQTESMRSLFINKIAQRYLVCLKINEPLLAEQIALDLFEAHDDESTRISMIQAALNAGVSIPEHLDWIDGLEELSPLAKWLRGKVEEQLVELNESESES